MDDVLSDWDSGKEGKSGMAKVKEKKDAAAAADKKTQSEMKEAEKK